MRTLSPFFQGNYPLFPPEDPENLNLSCEEHRTQNPLTSVPAVASFEDHLASEQIKMLSFNSGDLDLEYHF